LNPVYILLLWAYLLLPVYMPDFGAVNSNGPKFLAMAILNLVSLVVFLSDREFRQDAGLKSGFFRNSMGIVYGLFMLISLLSFSQALNMTAAVMNFSKLFTVFSASYMLFVILKRHRGYFRHIAIALAFMLLIDSVTVYYEIVKYIAGNVVSIFEIQSVYSNKNVFAAAIFVKVAASAWLMFFGSGWQKKLGYITVFSAALAIFFVSARAFYLGLVLLSAALALYAVLRFIRIKDKTPLIHAMHFAGLLVLALVVYSLTQRYLFPKDKDTIAYNKDVVTRVTEITHEIAPPPSSEPATPGYIRLSSWSRSARLLREHPWLGTGTGNWKIEVLKYENPGKADYNYLSRNHNDFMEIGAETGLIGGLAYLVLVFLAPFGFLRASWRATTGDEKLKYLFLPAMGMLAFSVDAFFNFPADRPEIQVLFAVYAASAAAYWITGGHSKSDGLHNSSARYPVTDGHTKSDGLHNSSARYPVTDGHTKSDGLHNSSAGYPVTFGQTKADPAQISASIPRIQRIFFNKITAAFMILLLFISAYVLFQNVKSLRFQRYVQADDAGNRLTHAASFIASGFPSIPNVTDRDEPVATIKARYLIHENRCREAITLLLADHSSPYDSRREFCLARAYEKIGSPDSAAVWLERAYKLKPLLKSVTSDK